MPTLRFVFENLTDERIARRGGHGGIVRAAGSSDRPFSGDRSVVLGAFGLIAREIARKPTRANSIISCSRPWPGWARRCRSSQPTCGCSRQPGFRRSRRTVRRASKSAVRRCRSSAIRLCPSGSTRSRGLLPGYADVAWQNAATNYLERTLDDSANRRSILPEALLCADEIFSLARKVVAGLRVDERRIAENLRTYGPFAGTEAVMHGGGTCRRGPAANCTKRFVVNAMDGYGLRSRAAKTIRSRSCSPRTSAFAARVDPAEIRRQLDPTHPRRHGAAARPPLADRIERLAPFPRQMEVRM